MTLRIVVVGAGVVGLITALRALDAGHRVHLIECEVAHPSAVAASWGGTRIIRDDADAAPTWSNTQRWRRLLRAVGGKVDTVPGVTHVRGMPMPLAPHAMPLVEKGVSLETEGFVVDTHGVFRALLARLLREPHFAFVDGIRVRAIDDATARVHATDGRSFEGDLVLVTAGAAGAGILDVPEEERPETRVQVCALLRPDSAHGRPGGMPTFIYNGGDGEGGWGTPCLAGHPAKISAPDLCFGSRAEAAQFTTCAKDVHRFLDRTRRLLPALQDADLLRWDYGTYAATRGVAMLKGRTTRAFLACDGGGFKRAPSIADKLLES